MNRIRYGVILGIVLLPTLFVGGSFAWAIFGLFLFVLTLDFWNGYRFFRNIVLMVWHARDEVESGDGIELKLVLSNTGLCFVPWVTVNMEVPEKLAGEKRKGEVVQIGPVGSTSVVYRFQGEFKGKFQFENIRVTFSDLFGLFHWTKNFDESFGITVLPKKKRLNAYEGKARQPFGNYVSKNKAFEDFSSIRDIRKYQQGDSFKRIHWKLSAHKGELYIREPEATGTAELVLILDLFHGSYSEEKPARYLEEEVAGECVLAVARKALEGGIPVRLIYFSEEIYSIKLDVNKGLEPLQEILASLNGEQEYPAAEILRNELSKGITKSDVLLITSQLRPEFFGGFSAKDSLSHVTVLCQSVHLGKETLVKSASLGVPVKGYQRKESMIWIGEIGLE